MDEPVMTSTEWSRARAASPAELETMVVMMVRAQRWDALAAIAMERAGLVSEDDVRTVESIATLAESGSDFYLDDDAPRLRAVARALRRLRGP